METVPEMLKKKLNKDKLATVGEDKIRKSPGNLKLADILDIARQRGGDKSTVTMILGTCQSCGISVDGRSPKDIIKDIKEGVIQVEI